MNAFTLTVRIPAGTDTATAVRLVLMTKPDNATANVMTLPSGDRAIVVRWEET